LKSEFLFIDFDSKLHRDLENTKEERIISTKYGVKKNPTTTLNMKQWAVKEPFFSRHGNGGRIGSPN